MPKRGCMRVADAASVQAVVSSASNAPLLGFRSLLPQGPPSCKPPAKVAPHHLFTISNASAGPHGGILFRVEATVHGQRARCLIDCGATSDFISVDFLRRHGLEKHMLTTGHLVRGYDGQLTPAAGVIEAQVAISALGEAKDGTPQRLLAAQLHSDDVILGLPWLTATGAIIDFAARSVALDHSGERHTISLAQASRSAQATGPTGAATTRLMKAVVALYAAELEDDSHVSHSALAGVLRDTDCDRDCPRQCPRHPSRDVSRRGLLACLLLALSLLISTLLTREDTSHIHSFTHVSLLTRPNTRSA